MCLPVLRPLPGCPGVECKELPAARAASLTFTGPYDTIWNAHTELAAWVADHGYAQAGPVRETGIVEESDTDDPQEWVTELSVPVSLTFPPGRLASCRTRVPASRDRRRTRPRG